MVSANSWFFGTFPDQTNSALDPTSRLQPSGVATLGGFSNPGPPVSSSRTISPSHFDGSPYSENVQLKSRVENRIMRSETNPELLTTLENLSLRFEKIPPHQEEKAK